MVGGGGGGGNEEMRREWNFQNPIKLYRIWWGVWICNCNRKPMAGFKQGRIGSDVSLLSLQKKYICFVEDEMLISRNKKTKTLCSYYPRTTTIKHFGARPSRSSSYVTCRHIPSSSNVPRIPLLAGSCKPKSNIGPHPTSGHYIL